MHTHEQIEEQINEYLALWREEVRAYKAVRKPNAKVPFHYCRIICQLETIKDWLNDKPANIVPLPRRSAGGDRPAHKIKLSPEEASGEKGE